MSWNQDAKCGIYIYECTPINIDTMRYIYASLSNEYFLEDECYRKLLQKRIEAYVDEYYLECICSSGCSERSGCSRCSGRSGNSGCLRNSGRSCSCCSDDFDDLDSLSCLYDSYESDCLDSFDGLECLSCCSDDLGRRYSNYSDSYSDGSVYCLNGFICPGCLEYLASSQYSDCYEDSECSDARHDILMVCDA